MQPTASITRMDLGLTGQEFDLMADRAGFIGPRVAPVVEVGLQAATYPKRSLEQLLKTHDTKRTPRSGYANDDGEWGTGSYVTEDHGLEGKLDDRELAIYKDVIDAEQETVEATTDGLLRRFEIDVAAFTFNTTTWTGATLSSAVAIPWIAANEGTAQPIDEVDAAREKIFTNSGLEPNALIINRSVMRNLRKCQTILDKIKFVMGVLPKEITPAILAAAFDLDFVIVAGSGQNTANEAQARAISRIWSGSYAMLAKVGVTRNLREPCILRTFVWNGNGGGGPGTDQELAYLVEERRNPNDTGTIYRSRNDRGITSIYPQAGFLLTGVSG